MAVIWTPEEEILLKNCREAGEPLSAIARKLGRSKCSIRAKITKLGIAKKRYWTSEEIKELIDLYTEAGRDGFLGLNDIAKKMNRDAGNLSRKAAQLGLPTSYNRQCVKDKKVRENKYPTEEARNKAASNRMKIKWKTQPHPKGMKGKKHSEELKEKMRERAKKWNASLTQEEKAKWALKSAKTRERNGTLYQDRKASWKSGWRNIGGIDKYYRSIWEANYARYLQWLKERGEIKDWKHEPKTFWFEDIKRGTRSYLPDFLVTENNGSESYHEVKGWMDDRSKTKIKRMAKYYPEIKLIVIQAKEYKAIKDIMKPILTDWELDSKGR